MDLSMYFSPISSFGNFQRNQIGKEIDIYTKEEGFPDLENCKVAVIGVLDATGNQKNQGAELAPDAIRKHFYALFKPCQEFRVADLGNLKAGSTRQDTYHAIKSICAELIKAGVIPFLIGGSHDLTFGNFLAYKDLEQTINLVVIDNKINLGDPEDELNSDSFLSNILLHQPNYLFNFSQIAYQTYYCDQEILDLLNSLFFDAYRLGEVNQDVQAMEPVIRNADILSFDISAIRYSDAPGNNLVGPNGLDGEQACQLMRYAGLSDKLSSVGIYEVNPMIDPHGQTAQLAAQMIWYFCEGVMNRKNDFPVKNKKEYLRYRVNLRQEKQELIFYKSMRSDRWWLDVPFPPTKSLNYQRHHIVPCTYRDYQMACDEEIPEVWWKTYQKLS